MADVVFESLLIHRAHIEYCKSTISSNKRNVQTYETLNNQTDVACRVKPIKVATMQAVAGAVYDANYKIQFNYDATVREKGRITIASGPYAGTYEVMGVEPYAEEDGTVVHHITAYVKKQMFT